MQVTHHSEPNSTSSPYVWCLRFVSNHGASSHTMSVPSFAFSSSQKGRWARRALYSTTAAIGIPLLASFGYAEHNRRTTPQDEIGQSHTFRSIWYQSLTSAAMSYFGRRARSEHESSCLSAASDNEALLLSLLDRCRDTAYGLDHGFSSIQSREAFRDSHPLTDHGHYRPYIDRVVHNGEENVMFPERPRMIGKTSGTSGTVKLVPVAPLQRKVFFARGIGVAYDAMVRGVGRASDGLVAWPNLQKSCKLMFAPRFAYTDHGMKVGPNSSVPGDNRALLQLYSTPPDAYEVETEPELLFLHCLYALSDRNLGIIESNFIMGVFNFFACIDANWRELVEAVRTGMLPENLEISDSTRLKLESGLVPNPIRASDLEQIVDRKGDTTTDNPEDIIKGQESSSFARRVWPKLHTIMANETGSFHLCGKRVRELWVGNDVTIFSPLYAATEGLIGVNLDVSGRTYTLCPRSMFFEFLPIQLSDESNDMDETDLSNRTLFIEELVVGEEYEMIITNLTGLYRYRFGDVIRCVGYEGQSPVVEVAYRRGQFLNAQGERTSEETFYRALSMTVEKDWRLDLCDYTCVEYFLGSGSRPRYTVFLELNDDDGMPLLRNLTRNEIEDLDKTLCKENVLYGFFRSNGRLDCIDAKVVRADTFRKVRDTMVGDLGASATQIKQPRVTRDPRLVRVLEEGKVD